MSNQPSFDNQPDYRTFDIVGSHAQLGYELGKADPPFAMQFWWSPSPRLAFADACRDVVHDLHPHLLDEFDAYADAQRLSARELWQKCCRVNLKARVKVSDATHLRGASHLIHDTTEGCSTFVKTLKVSETFRVLVGRNYDYLPQQVRRQRIRFVPDCCALANIGARGGVPCGRYDGINAHGLFASLHVVMTDTPDEDEVRPGVPFHLVVRSALETCHTAREAADLIARLPHLSSLNYLVADAQDAFVIEADPRRVRVIEHPEPSKDDLRPVEGRSVLAATNHYRHPDMRPLQGSRAFTNSECRLSFLSTAPRTVAIAGADAPAGAVLGGSEFSSSIDSLLDHAEATMADRTAPMCGTSGSLTTLWSCVAELTTKRIRYAAGAPGTVTFDEMLAV